MPLSIWQETLSDFVEKVGSSKPVPGGGAVAALCACLAASLLKMVIEITTRDGSNLNDRLAIVMAAKNELQKSVEDDIQAFNSFLAARRMPQLTDSDKTRRQELVTEALQRCTEVPITAVQAALTLVPIARELMNLAPEKVLSELGVALAELNSGLFGLSFTVDINLRGTESDPAFQKLAADRNQLASQIAPARRDLADAIQQVAGKIAQA